MPRGARAASLMPKGKAGGVARATSERDLPTSSFDVAAR